MAIEAEAKSGKYLFYTGVVLISLKYQMKFFRSVQPDGK